MEMTVMVGMVGKGGQCGRRVTKEEMKEGTKEGVKEMKGHRKKMEGPMNVGGRGYYGLIVGGYVRENGGLLVETRLLLAVGRSFTLWRSASLEMKKPGS